MVVTLYAEFGDYKRSISKKITIFSISILGINSMLTRKNYIFCTFDLSTFSYIMLTFLFFLKLTKIRFCVCLTKFFYASHTWLLSPVNRTFYSRSNTGQYVFCQTSALLHNFLIIILILKWVYCVT